MAAVKLAIVFDDERGEEPRYDPGSVLSGRAVFTSGAETTVDGASLSVHWKTRGRGVGDNGEAWSRKEAIPEGGRVVEAVQTMSWPFRCQLPESPWSYTGKYVSIVWEVSVTLDVPWARDPKAARTFILRPPPA